MGANGSRETLVRRQQPAIEALGEGDVRGIVCGEIVPELEDPLEQLLVTVSADRHVEVIPGGLLRSLDRERSSYQGAAEPGGELHIAQSGDVQIDVASAKEFTDRVSGGSAEEVFEQCGSIGNQDAQEASRRARSSRMKAAAGRPSLTGDRASIRSNTSSAGGLATSRSRSSWM